MLEIALRIFAAFPTDSTLFVNDSDIGYRMRPNLAIGDNLRTNSLGFNDFEHTKHRREDSVRIGIIGDSFVFGAVPRDKNFTIVLQKFVDRAGVDVEVLNMGIPAAGPQNYLAVLKNDAVLMNVDILCVVFFVGNDIIQSHPHFKTVIWIGSTREVLQQPHLVGVSKEYFYVYRAARSVTRLIRERIDKTPRESFTIANFLSIEYQRSEIYKISESSYIRKSYTGAVSILKEIAGEAERLKKKFFVVLAPDELQISNELRLSLAEEYNMNMNNYDFEKPQRTIANELRKSGIPVVDILPSFQAVRQKEALYIKQDTHWNEAGNRLVAKIIWSYLNKVLTATKVQWSFSSMSNSEPILPNQGMHRTRDSVMLLGHGMLANSALGACE